MRTSLVYGRGGDSVLKLLKVSTGLEWCDAEVAGRCWTGDVLGGAARDPSSNADTEAAHEDVVVCMIGDE